MINLINEIKKSQDINEDNLTEFIGYPLLREETPEEEVDRINTLLLERKDLKLRIVGRYYIISKEAKVYIDVDYDDKFNDLLNTYRDHECQVDENISNIYFEMDSRIKEMEAITQYMESKIEKLEKVIEEKRKEAGI